MTGSGQGTQKPGTQGRNQGVAGDPGVARQQRLGRSYGLGGSEQDQWAA